MYYTATIDQTDSPITIRAAGPQDVEAVRGLAQRDSRAVPDGELLIALVDGEARAAISLESGGVIADPFHRTAELVDTLRLHGSRLRGKTRRTGSAALSPQPVC
jgi:hypothetical protein